MNSQNVKNEKAKKGSKRVSKGGKASEEEVELLRQEGLIKSAKSELHGIDICPREGCGLPIDYVRKDIREGKDGVHIYYYAVHYMGTDGHGRPKLIQHYLGALQYDYVERVHKLGLRGYVDAERENNYLKELLDRLVSEGKMSVYDIIYILDKIEQNLDKVILDEDDKAELLMKLKEMIEKVQKVKVESEKEE